MTDEETMKRLCEIIRKLHNHSAFCWNNREDIHKREIADPLYRLYEHLVTNEYCLILDLEDRLQKSTKPHNLYLHINGETEDGNRKGRLYLPPLDEGPSSVAMLSLKCDLRSKKANIRIDVFTLFEDQPYGIGYRFEHGTHEFCHVSLTNKRPDTEGGEDLRNSPKWLLTDIPRVPMRANDPVSLLMDVLISFYGLKGYSILSS